MAAARIQLIEKRKLEPSQEQRYDWHGLMGVVNEANIGDGRAKVRLHKIENREVVSIPDRTSRTGAGKRKAPAASNRSAAHNVARRIAGRRSVAVLLRALLRAAS
jgi:hypothetical protein